MGQLIQFSNQLAQDTFLTPEEEEKLPPCYVEENIKVDYFAFLVENHLGTGNIAYERHYHFILDGNTLHVRVHNEERGWKWRWDGPPNTSNTHYYKFKVDASLDDPFILKKQIRKN